MKRSTMKTLLITTGIAALFVGASVGAAQATSFLAPTPEVDQNESYFVPGVHHELSPEQGITPEELDSFNRETAKNFERLVKENPDLDLVDLNQ